MNIWSNYIGLQTLKTFHITVFGFHSEKEKAFK